MVRVVNVAAIAAMVFWGLVLVRLTPTLVWLLGNGRALWPGPSAERSMTESRLGLLHRPRPLFPTFLRDYIGVAGTSVFLGSFAFWGTGSIVHWVFFTVGLVAGLMWIGQSAGSGRQISKFRQWMREHDKSPTEVNFPE
jgi:hypothetical protein